MVILSLLKLNLGHWIELSSYASLLLSMLGEKLLIKCVYNSMLIIDMSW